MDTWIVEFLVRPPQTEILVYLNNYNVYLNNCNDTLGRYKFGIFWEHGRLVRILPNRRLACFLK